MLQRSIKSVQKEKSQVTVNGTSQQHLRNLNDESCDSTNRTILKRERYGAGFRVVFQEPCCNISAFPPAPEVFPTSAHHKTPWEREFASFSQCQQQYQTCRDTQQSISEIMNLLFFQLILPLPYFPYVLNFSLFKSCISVSYWKSYE